MDNYQWHNDDFQNNTTNNTYSSYSSIPSEPTPPPHKKKKGFFSKTVKLPVMIVSMVVAVAVTVSGYAFLSPMLNEVIDNVMDGNNATSLADIQKSTQKDNDGNGNTVAQSIISTEGRVPLTIPEIAKKVGPTVVGVVNKVTYNNIQRYGIYGYYPDLYGQEDTTVESGSGSGVIISEDGYIVTNNHVVEGATEIYIITNTGEEYKAELVGSDSKTDLAVLKIEGSFPYASLGSSSNLEVGELAVAIGNPLGQEFAGTVTDGIISALNRSVTIDNKQLTLLQTNAAINPGNSGGPLVNQYGEVIGINTAKISSDQLEGLGFAIPIDEAKPIIDDLLQNGYVRGRPVIGIGGQEVSEQMAARYDNMKVGVYVASMSPNSPAYMAGVQIGDIIVEADGQAVKTVDELNEIKNKHSVGDELKLKIFRKNSYKDITIILGEEIPE